MISPTRKRWDAPFRAHSDISAPNCTGEQNTNVLDMANKKRNTCCRIEVGYVSSYFLQSNGGISYPPPRSIFLSFSLSC